MRADLAILGGGPAGLATAWYAGRNGLDPLVIEASGEVGGNCRTLRHGEHLFDTGAHRLHDRNPAVTADLFALMEGELHRVDAPSEIIIDGSRLRFPLAPGDLLRRLPLRTIARVGVEVIGGRLRRSAPARSFRQLAVDAYGRTLAELVLLNYTEKLWGCDAAELSPAIAGERLRHLDLVALVRGLLPGGRRHERHMEGAFYYPRLGIGSLFERMAERIGHDRIALDSRVTGLEHDGRRLQAVVVNGERRLDVDDVVSTLPLPLLVKLLREGGPFDAEFPALRYRHLLLVAIEIDRERVGRCASIYVPDGSCPITRIYEPKNRSSAMSPHDRTLLVAELPCDHGDELWRSDEADVIGRVVDDLVRLGLVERRELLGGALHRIPFAYPVLDRAAEQVLAGAQADVGRFENLYLAGRSSLFRYTHIHDMLVDGRSIVERLTSTGAALDLTTS